MRSPAVGAGPCWRAGTVLEGRDRLAHNQIIAIRDEAEVFGGAG